MRPNSRQLALRDPAAAALLGVIAGDNFGQESSYGADFAADPFGSEFGGVSFGDDYGADFGTMFGDQYGADLWGADFGAAPAHPAHAHHAHHAAHPAHPPAHPQQMAQMWAQHHKRKAKTAQRANLLEPNAGSAVKVERYAFPISQSITIGTAATINMTGSPDVDIRPQRVVCNVICQNFVYLTLIKVANVTVTVGPGVQDASDYANNAVHTSLDLPTLTPANRATIQGNYFGFIPPGFTNGAASFFVTSFLGPASIVA